jgi:hypothetical protein
MSPRLCINFAPQFFGRNFSSAVIAVEIALGFPVALKFSDRHEGTTFLSKVYN